MKKQFKLMQGDNMELLKSLPDNSIDSVVMDGPYGLGKEPDVLEVLKSWIEKDYYEINGKGFMDKTWDSFVPQPAFFKELNRVMKPGAHLLSFCGTRTYDWMVMAIRLGGFEVRDCISWIYGSGFPKSRNISKAYDKKEGNEREVDGDTTKGNSKYEGWGTALKPANEPICVARKPLSEKTIVENVIKWGTGGINIDGCRITTDDKLQKLTHQDNTLSRNLYNNGKRDNGKKIELVDSGEGRFPANIIFECTCEEVIKGEKGDIHTNPNCPCYQLDQQSGVSKSAGGASRFFYVAKVSKKERNLGLEGTILQLSNFMIKIDYNTKKIELWESQEQKAAHQEVMELLIQKDIEEYKLKEMMVNTIKKWNTELFGKVSMDQYQMVGTFITLMATNLITELKISNVLIEQNIKEDISECLLKMDYGKNIVANVMSGNQKNIIIEQKKDGCQDNANLVELKPQLKIKLKEEKNIHSTVKPIKLMQYLIRLVTPENGIVLDCFMGSGSTGIAAMLEGKRFIGMEMDADYFKIAEARINAWEEYKKIIK